MAGRSQYDAARPRVKVSLNLYEDDLQRIEDLVTAIRRREKKGRRWGKGNLMEEWILAGLTGALEQEPPPSRRRK